MLLLARNVWGLGLPVLRKSRKMLDANASLDMQDTCCCPRLASWSSEYLKRC